MSEKAHAVSKDDLAPRKMPSALFGANAAWWAIAIIAANLNTTMKRLVLGSGMGDAAHESDPPA